MKKYAVIYSDGSHNIYEALDIVSAAQIVGNDDNVVAIILHPVVGVHRGLHYAVAEMALAGGPVRLPTDEELGGDIGHTVVPKRAVHTPEVCPNCGQWQRNSEDCVNQCKRRGFA